MALNGSQIIARALKQQGVDDFFFIMGGPMLLVESECIDQGLRAIGTLDAVGPVDLAGRYELVDEC